MIILRMNDLDDKITSFVHDLKAEGNIKNLPRGKNFWGK